MLTSLFISNIVLINKLTIQFAKGLNIITGETGAGKSILLDALSLVLGAKSDISLIRTNTDTATVIAEFDYINDTVADILQENCIEYDNNITIRRNLQSNGKSKIWVNDIPISLKILAQIGDALVETHKQFESQSLLNPTTHLQTLDEYASMLFSEFNSLKTQIYNIYNEMHSIKQKIQELQDLSNKSQEEYDFLQYSISELQNLNIQPNEENTLAYKRLILMNAEKNATFLKDAQSILHENNSLDNKICSVAHILEKIKQQPNPYNNQIDKLYNAANIIAEVIEELKPVDIDTNNLEMIEERLFAIRSIARKHKIDSSAINDKLQQMKEQLQSIDNNETELQKYQSKLQQSLIQYNEYAEKIHILRSKAALQLHQQLLNELPSVKLDAMDFKVSITDTEPTINGKDNVVFMIKSNPGMPFAPLNKIASGGELSRLMLCLRTVLNSNDSKLLVFDEVDTGISGSTASAVGQKLKQLATKEQLLVITHSAQVAGFADKHFKISKTSDDLTTITQITEITGQQQIEEIARIISGAKITSESLATAKTLLQH